MTSELPDVVSAMFRRTCACGCGQRPRKAGAEYVRGHRPPSPASAYIQQCKISDCDRLIGPTGGRGLCPRHYQRFMATGDPIGSRTPAIVRFVAKLEPFGDCWLWTGTLDGSGYGMFSDRPTYKWITRAHRWSYEFHIAEIPDGLELDHLCHTEDMTCGGGTNCLHRRCVNPWHLEPVPGAVNASRGVRARPKSTCPQGHPYDAGNTYLTRNGTPTCRICRQVSRKRYEEKRAA